MIFDEDGFEYDPCWDCPFWVHGCHGDGNCPEDDLLS